MCFFHFYLSSAAAGCVFHLQSHTLLNCFKRPTLYTGSGRKQWTMWLVACWAVNKTHTLANWLISAQQPLGTRASISCLSEITNHHVMAHHGHLHRLESMNTKFVNTMDLLKFPIYRWRNWYSDRLSDCPGLYSWRWSKSQIYNFEFRVSAHADRASQAAQW